jgi:ankyrin repeat protein
VSSLELAKVLLDHGADPNTRLALEDRLPLNRDGSVQNPPLIRLGRHTVSYRGATPFYLAAKNGDAPYMRLLAEHGADPNISNALGFTPLMVASGLDYWEGESPGPFTGVSEAERLEAVKLAIELGNDINAAADFGEYKGFKMEGDPEYLLLYPPRNGDELAEKVPTELRWSGCAALHGAVVSNQPSIVQYLVDQGAKLDAKSTAGWTPLMMAGGVFFANAKRDFPAAAEILKKAMIERGLLAAGSTQ